VIATYASDAQPKPTIPFLPLLFLDATVRFVNVYKMSREAREIAIQAITIGLQEGWLKTTIASHFSLDRLLRLNEASESGKTIGKTIVRID
jgi:NADPH2:quinone reductase